IKGSGDRNILAGGGGLDLLDGGAGDDTVQASFTQLVYLDFDSATGPGEHAYTVDERDRIQARLQALYAAPFSVTLTQTPPAAPGGRRSVLDARVQRRRLRGVRGARRRRGRGAGLAKHQPVVAGRGQRQRVPRAVRPGGCHD